MTDFLSKVILTKDHLLYRRSGGDAFGCVLRSAIIGIEYGPHQYAEGKTLYITLTAPTMGGGATTFSGLQLPGMDERQAVAVLAWFYGDTWPVPALFDIEADQTTVEEALRSYSVNAAK